MFWGLIMEPGKKYSQVVEKDFHIAQAALDLDSAQDSPVQVLISIDGRNYLVCTLIKDKICQVNLDLNFRAGVKVSFATNGPGHVHLTGYLIEDNEFVMEEDSDEEIEEEESADEQVSTKKRKAQQQKNEKPNKKTKTAMMLDQLDEESYNEDDDSNVNLTDLMDDSDESDDESADEEAEDEEVDGEEGSDDDEDDEDDDDSNEEESSEEDVKPKVSPKKDHETPKQNGVAKKTPKNEKKVDKTPKGADKSPKNEKTPKGADKSPKNEKTPKGPKTPGQDKQQQQQQQQKTPKGNKSPGGDSGTPGKKKQLEGGVTIEDLKVGEGPVAKPGRSVRVYYEGRLKSNNKVFDSALKGAGFKFRLGNKEVIKGWDIGVAGMKIGGKRRITCPPHMAYGAAGSPPVIPPNSSLVFEVELKQIQ